MKAGRGGLLALAPIVAALAASAPAAHAGSYDVLSCTIDGSYHPNNAWVATNSPAGDARYISNASCPKSGDPLQVMLAGGNAFAFGTNAALSFTAPPDASITNSYSTRYRFNSGGGRFTFRLRLRPSDSYPYARGTSKSVRIRVG